MEPLLTIGEFAQRCGLSRSALRFYDQNELLRPQLVDEQTGYRYYAAGQVGRAELVRRLRAADMPVSGVRRYLNATAEERGSVLDSHLASFRERVTEIEGAVEELRRDLGDAAVSSRCWVKADRFAEGLAQVSFAIADPALRADLGAVWVETREGSLRLVATDSYRLAVRDLVPERLTGPPLSGVIEAAHATTLTGALSGVETLLLSQGADGVIEATIDGDPMTVGHAGAEFPDYEKILSGLPAGEPMLLARDAIRRALSELPAQAPHLELGFEPDVLALRAAGQTVTVAGARSGGSLRVFVDARFFREAVEATVGPDLVIESSDPLRPITLRSADTGTFSVLTMPIRPPESA